MPPTKQAPLLKSISKHAWNGDRKQLALSPNSSEVWIYNTGGKKNMKDFGKPTHKLSEHSGYVSAIDWNAKTNLIVTSAHDRNAYVWKLEGNEWKPTLVILRINRAATGVKWSPNGDKFAVTSGAKCVPVCFFEESNNWWISKMIKKHKSTVTSLDWSPNNKFVVTGATDFKCRIFSAFIENIDSTDAGAYGHWAKQNEFGECLIEFDQSKAWVDSVSWAPSGMQVAFSGHGSTLHFANLEGGDVSTTYCKSLPYHHIRYLSNDTLLAVGFDNNPTIFINKGGSWELQGKLDPEKTEEKKASGGGFGSAFAKFKQADSHGDKFGGKSTVVEAKTFHKNLIEDVYVFPGQGALANEFTTSGIDGRVLFWDAKEVSGCK